MNHELTGPGEGGRRTGRAKAKGSSALGPGQHSPTSGLASPPRRGHRHLSPGRRPLGRLQPRARPDPAPSPSGDGQPRRRDRLLPPCGDPHRPPTTLRSPGGGPGPGRGRRRSASCCGRCCPSAPGTARFGSARLSHAASGRPPASRESAAPASRPPAYRES